MTAIAVFLAIVMLATPVLQLGGNSGNASPVNNASAANGSRVFNVGVIGYVGDMATLNPFVYTMASEYETIWPCYSTLLTYDVNDNIIGDLATSWSVAPDGVTWNFKLARNAYFVDPRLGTTEAQIIAANKIPSHLVTYKDVQFTFWELNNDSANHLSSYFNTGGVGIIQSIWRGVDDFDLYVRTTQPYAPFIGSLTIIPIVPKYYWGTSDPMRFANDPPIGSGPFYYGMSGLPTTVGILKRNPMWFQEENKGWQIHIDTLQYKNEMSTDTAWTELTTQPTPLIDVYMGVSPVQYLNQVKPDGTTTNVKGFAQSTGFVYEYQLNQLTPRLRTELGMHSGSNNPLMSDPVVKEALAMSVDKTKFIQDVLLGLGTVADSVVPDVNRWHYTYPTPITFDTAAARTLLNNAGWKYDSAGALNPGATPLYKKGAVNNTVYHGLSFRLLSLLPEQEWDIGSRLIAGWAAQAGVQYTIELMSVNQANTAWYAGDYDAWLWDWYFTPTSDPSTDVLSVHTTMAIGSWSGSYWTNAVYNDLYNRSLVAVDETARRQLTDQMQIMLYEDHAAQYVAYRKELYAINYARWDEASFGNWEQHYTLMPDQGLPWLYMMLSPKSTDNPVPAVSLSATFEGLKGQSINFFGSATDNAPNPLYKWFWGDNTVPADWSTSLSSTTHTFANDGIYTIYFAAKENTAAGTDQFISWKSAVVTVIDPTNAAPSAVSITPSVPDPDTGTMIQFTGHATDTDTLYYTWNFGDTYTAQGQTASHQYTSTGTYTVTMSVTDNHVGYEARPVVTTIGLAVTPNHVPSITVPDHLVDGLQKNTFYTFTVTGSDADTRDTLRYTWDFGDKTAKVSTSGPTSPLHEYKFNKVYLMRVYLDDLTGLAGHNVSDTGTIVIGGATNAPPVISTYTATPSAAWAYLQTVAFVAGASDADSNDLTYTFNFGDGQTEVVTKVSTGTGTMYAYANHTYATAGSMSTTVQVSDGFVTTTSVVRTVTVTVNQPPMFDDLVDKTAIVGEVVSFEAMNPFDPEFETMTFTWTFGDGSGNAVGNPVTHAYATDGPFVFSVAVTDTAGNLVIKSATITVSLPSGVTINLVTGWNLVSIPVEGTSYTAGTLPGLQSGDTVVGYNPLTNAYDRSYIKGFPFGDFPLALGEAYWVYVGGPRTVDLTGAAPTVPIVRHVDVPAGGGWVLVGNPSLRTDLTASDLAAMFSGGADTVCGWDGASYITYIVGFPMGDFTLVAGQGYWLHVLGSGDFTTVP